MIKKFSTLALVVFTLNSAYADNVGYAVTNIPKAKLAADCAAVFISAGQLRTVLLQTADKDAITMGDAGLMLLKISALYSSSDKALTFYDDHNRALNNKMQQYMGSSTDPIKFANFSNKYLIPKFPNCMNIGGGLTAQLIREYLATDDGKNLAKGISKRLAGKESDDNSVK